ncbi:MAG TPA: amidase [Solirubrobacterales bacterium]|jgi:amidase|nr:amidase [Solirubrobacterales bacterium]
MSTILDRADGLVGQAGALAAGEVSSRELTERSLQRIEQTQPILNAFRVVCAEQALADAAAADRRLGEGERAPLLGVPVAIKDDVDLAGHDTPFGCAGEHREAEWDAEAVRRLRAAGAIVVGKTNAPEVGQWHFSESRVHGITRNPWHLGHTPGGSSGGAAAAVAAGIVAGAMGSDGAGSIRIPAAWTNLVGLKPQRGRVSTWPDAEAFNGLSCYGPLARTVADTALLLDVLAGNVPADRHQVAAPPEPFAQAAAEPPRPLRVALSFATPIGAPGKLDPQHRAAAEAIAVALEASGHEVEERDPDYGLVGAALIPRGMSAVNAWLGERGVDRAQLEPRTRTHARMGRLLSGVPLQAARAAELPLRRRMGAIFDHADVVLTPTTAQAPPRVDRFKGSGYWATSTAASAACPFAWPWNVVGWPALSVPAGFTADGLPIGAQLVAPAAGEARLLSLAGQLEATQLWHERQPPPLSL